MGIGSLISEYAPQGLEALGVGDQTANNIGKSLAPILSNAGIGALAGALTGKPGTGALAGAMNGLVHDKALSNWVNGPKPEDESVSVTGKKGDLTNPYILDAAQRAGALDYLKRQYGIGGQQQSGSANNQGGTQSNGQQSPMDNSPYSNSLGTLLAIVSAAGNQRPTAQMPATFNNHLSLPVQRATGGPVGALRQAFNTGGGNHFVRGPGDGTSDSVPANLSDGEYVLSAGDVSRIGQGSNEAGARRLDEMREAIAKDAGAKQHQPRVKHPIQYLREVSNGDR